MARFDHERLDVYRVSIQVVALIHRLTARARGHRDLVDQARRAAISIPLNIAEGTGEYSPKEKVRFYRIARRSATESAAALDVLHALGVLSEEALQSPRELLDRIVAMLTALVKEKEKSIPRPGPRKRLRPPANPPRPARKALPDAASPNRG